MGYHCPFSLSSNRRVYSGENSGCLLALYDYLGRAEPEPGSKPEPGSRTSEGDGGTIGG